MTARGLTQDDKLMMELQEKMTDLDIKSWLEQDFLSAGWWIQLAMFIVPWIIFARLAKRDRLPELALYGSWVLIAAETLDHIGYELGVWYYPTELAPLFPRFEEVNLSALPVIYMLVYQYFPAWKRFVAVLFVVAVLFTLAAEPALIWLGLYTPLHWKPYYGLPIYVAIGVVLKWLVGKVFAAPKGKSAS
ncbi:CBO0543 family protein [Anaeroselena agilis]|uniref:CBO0543 family protein n=1 Tax=Anaeroselena agilis TaxID=3063788 RepID=A0ABU3NUT7_9FIRM|nr:CBO0543 family protein [Selenomonadales bacterium 4137-cl]